VNKKMKLSVPLETE